MSALHSESSWNTAQRATKKCSLFVKHKHYTLAFCCLSSMGSSVSTAVNERGDRYRCTSVPLSLYFISMLWLHSTDDRKGDGFFLFQTITGAQVIVHYDTSAMKRFLTSVSLQHEPKASDVITLVTKTFFRTSIVRNFISRGVKMRISAREAFTHSEWYKVFFSIFTTLFLTFFLLLVYGLAFPHFFTTQQITKAAVFNVRVG